MIIAIITILLAASLVLFAFLVRAMIQPVSYVRRGR